MEEFHIINAEEYILMCVNQVNVSFVRITALVPNTRNQVSGGAAAEAGRGGAMASWLSRLGHRWNPVFLGSGLDDA
jgi:hypothetical protein